MARGLDHVVHAVRDLEAAAERYRALGFTVGARNRHPWGTENRLIQLPGFFVELITVASPELLPPTTDSDFSFGAFNRDFLAATGDGLSGLVLEGKDPAAEKAAFDAAGFGGYRLFEFSRKGRRPDGSETEVGFKIAFARNPAGNAAFFTCLQTRPENFWAPELQRHENGAHAIAACVAVAENPTDHHIFLETFVGVRDLRATSMGLSVPTPRGAVLALDPRGFRDRFGVEPPRDAKLRLAALVFAIRDLDTAGARLEDRRIAFTRHRGRLVVGPGAAFGAVLAFEAS